MHGFLVIDKPAGITSHDVVAKVRRVLSQKKVGHTGTLDPFATGVLPVALGDATKVISHLDESVKEYRAIMRLGITTDTQDCTGKVLEQKDFEKITETQVLEAFANFTGIISQLPPMFSAVKQGGVPLYKLARLGEEVERTPRQICIHTLSMNHYQLPFITFTVCCSRGTYVRTLAKDLGDTLGCGAHLVELRRLKSGLFTEDLSIPLQLLEKHFLEGHLSEVLISPLRALAHLPTITLTDVGAKNVGFGRSPSEGDYVTLTVAEIKQGQTVSLVHEGNLLAIASICQPCLSDHEKTIRLLRVFS
ncbi:MAG: tRNA pseudouridine(55) synthase TruB [Geobacteraceae bacterium]|nr:tRNA pseudouridine(55) synthase TruB [Geobacteraceae bacterium]